MDGALLSVFVLAQYIVSVILCARFTQNRGRGAAPGAVLGVFFGWFALFGMALMFSDDAPVQYSRYHLPQTPPSMARQLERLAELRGTGALGSCSAAKYTERVG
jgi:hypothetical protein